MDLGGCFLERTKVRLQQAVREDKLTDLKEALEELKEGNNEDLTVQNAIYERNNTLLHIAAENNNSNEIAAYLIDEGAGVNVQNDDGDTPLHLAVRNNKIEVVQCLLLLSADVNIQNNAGQTPLDIARANRNREIAELLTPYANEAGNVGNAPFHEGDQHQQANDEGQNPQNQQIDEAEQNQQANESDYGEDIEYPVEYDNKDENTINENSTDLSKSNLEEKIEKMTPDDFKAEVIGDVYKGYTKGVEELLKSNAAEKKGITFDNIKDVRVTTNGTNDTLLHVAVRDNTDTNMVLFLQMYGVDFNAQNAAGDTPLHLAVQKGNTNMISFLLERGADVTSRNNNGQTPLDIAIEKGNKEIIRILSPKNNKEIFENEIRTDGTDYSDNVSPYPEIQENDDDTLLHTAVRDNDINLVRDLVGGGADVNKRNKAGKTPLDIAKEKGNQEIIRILSPQNNEGFFENEIRTDGTDYSDNVSPYPEIQKDDANKFLLHKAVQENDVTLVQALVEQGVDTNEKNNDGKTPLDIALENGNQEILDLLLH